MKQTTKCSLLHKMRKTSNGDRNLHAEHDLLSAIGVTAIKMTAALFSA